MRTITKLLSFPIKACGSVSHRQMTIEDSGPRYDRRLMLVDPTGEFVTQRTQPRLALVSVEREDSRIQLGAPGRPDLSTTLSAGPRRAVRVWRYRGEANEASPQASEWFSSFLGAPVTLVECAPDMDRVVNPEWARRTAPLAFADGYPVLLISEASVEDVNRRLPAPLSALRFRPNLVVRSETPFEEDDWREFRIGDVHFDVVKPCDRCAVISVDLETGVPGPEPTRTLSRFRRAPAGILFGQNCIPRNAGTLHLGAEVEILRTGTPEDLPEAFRLGPR